MRGEMFSHVLFYSLFLFCVSKPLLINQATQSIAKVNLKALSDTPILCYVTNISVPTYAQRSLSKRVHIVTTNPVPSLTNGHVS